MYIIFASITIKNSNMKLFNVFVKQSIKNENYQWDYETSYYTLVMAPSSQDAVIFVQQDIDWLNNGDRKLEVTDVYEVDFSKVEKATQIDYYPRYTKSK